MNADNHGQPLIVRIVASKCPVKNSNDSQGASSKQEATTQTVKKCDQQTSADLGLNNKLTGSLHQKEEQPSRQRHLNFDKSDTRGQVASSARDEEAAACERFVQQQTCEPNTTTADEEEKRSRFSWLAIKSNDDQLNATSANQLKRQHHSSRAAAANSHCINVGQKKQQQVKQTNIPPNNSNEAGGFCPIESQVATSTSNNSNNDDDDDDYDRSTNNVQASAIKPPTCQDEQQVAGRKNQAGAQIQNQPQEATEFQLEPKSQPSSEQQDYQAAAESGSSLLFWKFLSNLPTSITQRGRSSPGLAPEVAGYLANKQRQRKCDSNNMPPKTASTSTSTSTPTSTTTTTTGTDNNNMDNDTRPPPPYDGCHQAAATCHQTNQQQQQHSQEMTTMNYSGGNRGATTTTMPASGSKVIRIVAPNSEPAQINTDAHHSGGQHDHDHHHHHQHQQNLQSSSIRERLNKNEQPEQQQQQHLQATNRTKLSIASSRTTTRSSATSLSSCILSDSSSSEVVRLKWDKKMDFLLSIIGFAVDLANIWRFPYLVYKNGGGVFLIPYLTMLIFGGIPLFFLELCLGQFVKKGPLTVWNKICPSMKGVGYCSIMISWYVSFYYNVLIAWSVYFIYRSLLSFGDKMPWEDCNNSWNSKGTCVSISQLKELCSHRDVSLETCRRELFANVSVTSPASEFFVKELSQIDQSTGLNDMGYLRWELVFCTMIVYLLHYFSLFRGLETSGKVVWVTATAPYMILSILLVRGLFLPGATMGIEYYLSPKLEKLADPQVWIDAAGQVFYSIGVGFGVHLTYASFNSHNNNCYRDCLMTSAVNAATSVYSGLVVFVYLGYMAKNLGIEIDKVASEGYSLVFEVYPEALTTLPFARFWSILFFIMLLTLGIDSAMGGLEAVITGLEDEFKLARRLSRGQLTGLVIVSSFLPALISCTQGGAYTLFWFDIYSAGVSLLFSALFETIGVVYCYGLDKFIPNIESMLGRKPPLFYILCWKYISPIFLVVVIFMSIYTAGVPTYRGYTFPLWSIILGWCFAFSSVVAIPVFAIWYWARRWFTGSSSDKSGRKHDRGSTIVAV